MPVITVISIPEVDAVAPMVVVVVHHVAEITVEEIESTVGRTVGCCEPEMPLADERCTVAHLLQHLRE